jgi:hypothetical protein
MLAGTTTRNRQDSTKILSPEQRRLDSLAKLFAAHSECVAVFILDGQIYITANELFKGTQIENNKNYAAIKEIMGYFQKMAKSESITPEERENIFVKICSTARFKESSPEGIAEKIAKDVLEGKGLTLTIDDIYVQYKGNVAVASRMYGEFAKLRKHFLKLEQVCSSPAEELQSLKNTFSQDFIILKEEASSGIHAEVQLLAEAIKSNDFLNQNKKIYIGISKLCCLHCRCMLETANEELKKNGVEFIFRGKHDLDFSANWSPPSIFEKGYNSVRRNPRSTRHDTSAFEENTLGFAIGKNSKTLIDKLSDEVKPKGISMDASESSSEEGGKTEVTIYKQKAFLESNLQLIASMTTEDLVSTRKLISIALAIHDSNAFLQLSKIAKSIPDPEKTDYLAAIMGEMNSRVSESEEKITLEKIIKIIKNSKLVGDSLAEAFKEYIPDLTKQSHEKNFRNYDGLPKECFTEKEVGQSLNQERSKDKEQNYSKDNKKHEGPESDQPPLKKYKM